MRLKNTLFLGILLVGSFFVFYHLNADAKVVVSKIQVTGKTAATDEYVELYNFSNSPAPLDKWSLKKQTSSGTQSNLVASFPSSAIINPFSYFLVAHANYQPINGVNADLSYSNNSFSLADNNSVLLLDNAGMSIDEVIWGTVSTTSGSPAANPASGKALVRLPNDDTGNGQDSDDSSIDFIELDTPVFNSFSPSRPLWVVSSTPSSTPNVTSTPGTPTSTPNQNATSSIWSQIKLNEIFPYPAIGQQEWIELYNPTTSSLDLSGGILCDGRTSGSCTIVTTSGTISGLSWATYYLSSSHLNNDGDSVILKNPDGTAVDQIAYSGSLVPQSGQAVARTVDGAGSWSITTAPTPNTANVIVLPPPPPASGSTGGGSSGTSANQNSTTNSSSPTSSVWATSTSPLVLNELLPNPEGSDTTDEFIEVKNISPNTINLADWKLSDPGKLYTIPSGTLGPGELAVFVRPNTGISLNNTARETIRLYTPEGTIADEVSYDSADEGLSYSRSDEDKKWYWTESITKGLPNSIERADTVGLVWKIIAPHTAAPGETVTFDAEDSADPRGGLLTFNWNFGDGTTSEGSAAAHAFATSGTYTITVSASSTQGTVGKKQLTITIGETLSTAGGNIVFSEIFVNPTGADSKEFIELYNTSAAPISIADWKLSIKNGKSFVIPEGTTLAAGAYAVFTRSVTKLSIDNNGDTIKLETSGGNIVDLVKFNKSVVGQSYALLGNEWHWTPSITPGKPNQLAAVLGQKITAVTASRSTISRTYQPILHLSLADVREQPKDARVAVKGTVSSLPGTFGSQYFYIADDQGGIQIYQYKKQFPELALGDYVAVTGAVSEAAGVKRIRVQKADDIDILAIDHAVSSTPVELGGISEEALGDLVSVQGEITELKTNSMYIDDGTAEIDVYFKQGAKIDKSRLKVGDRVSVTGILEAAKSGWQLWPRGNDDIQILGPSEEELKQQAAAQEQKTSTTRKKYAIVTAGGLLLIVGALAKTHLQKALTIITAWLKNK